MLPRKNLVICEVKIRGKTKAKFKAWFLSLNPFRCVPESNRNTLLPRFKFGSMRRALLNPTYVPAILTVLVLIVAASFAEYQNNSLHQQRLRADVLTQMSVVRAKLEGSINANLQLVRGLIAAIATEPDMDQERFDDLASKLFGDKGSQLRSIAVAPDLVVTMTYPLEGNERAIGLDYRQNEAQREAALRVISSEEMVLAGPVELIQGGRGFIGRFPVFLGEREQRRFWGLVSAVIDVERLYKSAGLGESSLPIDIALAGKDGLGRTGEQFYGDLAVFSDIDCAGLIAVHADSLFSLG